MPNLNGTAEDHKDMMNILRQFLTGYGVITYPITYAGTGDGPIYKVAAPPPAVSETWTLVCTLGGGNGVATFSVTGSVSGLQANVCTVGEFYESDSGEIEFVIQDGPTDFVAADQFDITVTQSTWTLGTDEWAVNRWCPPKGDTSLSSFDFPNNAFDGQQSTNVSKLGVSSGTLHMKFPDAVAWDQYFIQARNTGFDATEAPLDWDLEWSDDGVNWTSEDNQTGQIFTIAETKTYSLSTDRHIWWRLNVTNNNGGTDIEFSRFGLRQAGQTVITTEEDCLMLQGQGLAGADEIYIGMQLEEDELAPYYNWQINGFVDFDSVATYLSNPGISNATRYVSNNQSQEFWLTGNGRYVQLTTRQTTDYTAMYMGLLLPYGEPTEYSYPLIILGGSQVNRHYTSTDIRHRMPFDPGESAGVLRLPGGTWDIVRNYTSSQLQTGRMIWPYNTNGTAWEQVIDNITEGLDGSYEIYPLIAFGVDDDVSPDGTGKNCFGEIQDIFYISGSNNSAENTLTIGPDTYIVFQNVFRTEFNNFYAVRLNP